MSNIGAFGGHHDIDLQAGVVTLRVSLDAVTSTLPPADIVAGPADARRTFVGGADPSGCIARTPCSLSLTLQDAYGNDVSSSADGLTVESENATQLVVSETAAGVFEVSRQSYGVSQVHTLVV